MEACHLKPISFLPWLTVDQLKLPCKKSNRSYLPLGNVSTYTAGTSRNKPRKARLCSKMHEGIRYSRQFRTGSEDHPRLNKPHRRFANRKAEASFYLLSSGSILSVGKHHSLSLSNDCVVFTKNCCTKDFKKPSYVSHDIKRFQIHNSF